MLNKKSEQTKLGDVIFMGWLGAFWREYMKTRTILDLTSCFVDLKQSAIIAAERISIIKSKPAKLIASNALKALNKPIANILYYPREIYG